MAEDVRVRFGRRLQKLRKQRGWKQVQLAERLGLDRSSSNRQQGFDVELQEFAFMYDKN